MKSIRKFCAIIVGKIISFFAILIGNGSGAAAPGLVALKIYPELITDLCKNIEKKKIIISATNGKTTTATMVRAILENNCDSYISNQTGSNLARGIASSLIKSSNLIGEFKIDYGVFEVDEAVLPYMIKQIKPDIVVLGNVFRDQLDRYGEIDAILAKWQKALRSAKPETQLLLNGDDPGIAGLRNGLKLETFFYGIDAKIEKDEIILDHAADSINCPICSKELQYKSQQFSNLRNYQCNFSGFNRPKIDLLAKDIDEKLNQTQFDVDHDKYEITLGGIYNVYNALAAIGVARLLDISYSVVNNSFKNVKPAFGRMEEFQIDGQKYKIILIKNPTGANAVINIFRKMNNKNILIALNDRIADGTDVSWIYDTDWEKIGDVKQIVCMGTRRYDMAIRLKYAHIEIGKIKTTVNYLSQITSMKNKDDYVYILPTYTAMLEIRSQLEKKKIVEKI